MKKFLLAACAAVSMALGTQGAASRPLVARVTYYNWTGSRMFNGEWPHYGAAACSWNLALGTVIVLPNGEEVVCKDRGGGLVTKYDRWWLCWPNCTDVWVDVYGRPDLHWAFDWTTVWVIE